MSAIAVVRRMLAAGWDLEAALAAGEAFEAEIAPMAPALTPDSDARRRRIYREQGLSAAAWAQRWQEIFERDGCLCRYCGDEDGPFHIDHILPLSRGGASEHDNLAVACHARNRSKKNRTLAEWNGRK